MAMANTGKPQRNSQSESAAAVATMMPAPAAASGASRLAARPARNDPSGRRRVMAAAAAPMSRLCASPGVHVRVGGRQRIERLDHVRDRRDRSDGGDGTHHHPDTCTPPSGEHQHQRPHEVELLFDGERPEVVERRGVTEPGPVVAAGGDGAPVGRPGHCPQQVASQTDTTMSASGHTTATTASTSRLAGNRRRAREAQKRRNRTDPPCSISPSSFQVISQPDTTKKASTPRMPPGR